ncbi:cation transporter [Volucribacter amazonae]|uniref:Cobalt transporter n=1 Tax=Volucribacter amazonae TaxID=256731 RepID=A0A9X4PCC0_9PAST|nr:cation transporter [Volucribacter amazonae]MDG6895547.1 cobalt transporter [Volucribacter amazonae]
MSCCQPSCVTPSPTYAKVLWAVLAINFVMFLVEILGGLLSGSTALLADALDFFGDAFNYGLSLWVLNRALSLRAKASLLKGYSLLILAIFILLTSVYRLVWGDVPNHFEMSLIGGLALLANVISALLLYRYRQGDSNMTSVWLCSRNDAIGNILVVFASMAVYYSQSNLPDLLVAGVMAWLALQAGIRIIGQATQELQKENETGD